MNDRDRVAKLIQGGVLSVVERDDDGTVLIATARSELTPAVREVEFQIVSRDQDGKHVVFSNFEGKKVRLTLEIVDE